MPNKEAALKLFQEFDRQVENLVQKEYFKVALVPADEFIKPHLTQSSGNCQQQTDSTSELLHSVNRKLFFLERER